MEKVVLHLAHRRVANLRRYAAQTCAFVPLLLFFVAVAWPHEAQAQSCDWEVLPAPGSDTNVIQVVRSGGYGPDAGRTLVRVDASGQTVWVPHGRCANRSLTGRLDEPSFADLEFEFRRAIEVFRGAAPDLFVSDEGVVRKDIGERPRGTSCQSMSDGEDVEVIFYGDGKIEQYKCASGALLRFGERVLRLVPDAICALRPTGACAQRIVGSR